MDLTQEEKERILAEERYRLEAKQQISQEHHGCCGHGFHQVGFWKGFLLGIILSALVGLAFHHHCRSYGPGYGHGFGRWNQENGQQQGSGPHNQQQDSNVQK